MTSVIEQAPTRPDPTARPADGPAIVDFTGVSKWYGQVIGLNNLTVRIPAGVTGLLGPNGAGKSTFLQLATGQLRPSMGTVRVLGQPVWNNPGMNRWIGLCPEQDAFYEWMTGWEFILACAHLSGLGGGVARNAAAQALEYVKMTPNMNRAIRGYSKGMRQRTKIAQALVHEPKVLFLDEPMSGTDPLARRDLHDLMLRLGDEGRSIVLSSHVLYEVQGITPPILLLNRGKLVAEGHLRQIRDLIDEHPHRIVIVSPQYRRVAARLVEQDDVVGMELRPREEAVVIETKAPDTFYQRLPTLALAEDTPIHEVYSDDDNLEAVFKYLVSP
ncbi:MAG TPA: ABC transporter ATP-binding protein [Gemmatales bacterium]|nr:ABC transporter ATP-binding protein [Gemmatales bacterium]